MNHASKISLPGKHAEAFMATRDRLKANGGADAYHKQLLGEIAALEKSTGAKADETLSAEAASLLSCHRLEGERDRLKSLVKPSPKAAPAQAPRPADKVTGAALLEAVTNPAVNGPVLAGLQQSLAARLGLENSGPRCTREEFETLTHAQRNKFFANGGRITQPQEAVPPLAPGANTCTRAQFENLTQAERSAFFKAGGKISKK